MSKSIFTLRSCASSIKITEYYGNNALVYISLIKIPSVINLIFNFSISIPLFSCLT